ncbi:hypothetical protein C0995_011474 [Termitomyces sp. Mi166|nr:hypothetical protein C0995_011474 [Termitomyces sp. Mi166\
MTTLEPLMGRGKGIDPRNWGGIALEGPEIDPLIQRDMFEEFNALCDLKNQAQTQNPEPNVLTTDIGDIAGGKTRRDEEMVEETAEPEVSREDVLDYLRNKKKLQCEMDRRNKKERTSHKKRKERAGSEPLSSELATLIQKVAEGSKTKDKYKPSSGKKHTKYDSNAATKPITQITAKSALGCAFGRLDKHRCYQPSEDSDPSNSSLDSEKR